LVSNMPGSDLLTTILDTISQGLQIPVIILLIIFAFAVIIILGGIIAEYRKMQKIPMNELKDLVYKLSNSNSADEMKGLINSASLANKQKRILNNIIDSKDLDEESRIALAHKYVEHEENRRTKILEKTDIITRIGPTLGLMGTLIPMGPGLAALGNGDVTTLSQAIIVAFDTTVVGIGAGALAYVIGKIRRRWYEEYVYNLDMLTDVILSRFKKI